MPTVIVHISGYNLREIPGLATLDRFGKAQHMTDGDWHHVCWGDRERPLLGRIPMGIWIARKLRAEKIIWSTGCSERAEDGVSEAKATYQWAYEHHKELSYDFPHRFPRLEWNNEHQYREWLSERSYFDEKSKNTSESMLVLRDMIKAELGSGHHVMLYLVSSANHMPRVLRDAESVFDVGTPRGFMQHLTLCAVPAETNYGNAYVGDTKVDDLGRMLVPVSHSR